MTDKDTTGPKCQLKKRKRKSSVPVPKSYLDAMAKKRADARKVSGFDRLRVRFVQGGAPGGGRKA